MTNPHYHIVQNPSDTGTLQQPGIIRWATGHPDGPQSLTWSVLGAKNSDNVYVGTRGMMDAAKLSLRESGVWRFAFTPPGAEKVQLPEGADRLIER